MAHSRRNTVKFMKNFPVVATGKPTDWRETEKLKALQPATSLEKKFSAVFFCPAGRFGKRSA